jgi:hypothetical protein
MAHLQDEGAPIFLNLVGSINVLSVLQLSVKKTLCCKLSDWDHPHLWNFKISFKTKYSVLVIEILSFIFTSPTPIFFYLSRSSQQPCAGPTHHHLPFFFPSPPPLPPTPRPLSPTPPPRLLRRCIGAEPRSSARRRIEAEPRSRAEDEDEGRAGHGAPVCIDRGPGGTQSRARPTSTR